MMKFLVLAVPALVAALPTPQDDEVSPQIVGGYPAQAGEFPSIVSIQGNGRHFCGGTLIDGSTVLTAAHCVADGVPAGLAIRAGSLDVNSGGVVVAVGQYGIHNEYNPNTSDNDFALLYLNSNIPQDGNIVYSALAGPGSDPAPGSTARTAGWGALSEGGSSPSNLYRVDVPIVDRGTCNNQYGGGITENMVCAGFPDGGRDSCQGDSGGPLVDAGNTLIGVVSFGNGCARPNFPGVYANVANSDLLARSNFYTPTTA